MNSSILYISYDGMLEPLGQSQVLAYLERLATDYKIHLISFEKPGDFADELTRAQVVKRIAMAGITWVPLRYHKKPSALATAYDILHGIVVGALIVLRQRVQIVHARSYVPSVMVVALKWMFGVKFVFDMRGFWADERIDGGIWPSGSSLYKVAKWFERRFLLNADCVVSLTQAAVDEMRGWHYLQGAQPKFRVITTCADLDVFSPNHRTVTHPRPWPQFTVGYVGSAGGWYLFDETLRCFVLLREQISDARLHIVNRGEHPFIRQRLAEHAIPWECVTLEAANHEGVAQAMRNMDATMFFIKPAFSKIASAPTKLGEFLGCGVPCMGNRGVGDMAAIITPAKVGVVIDSFDDASLRSGVRQLIALVAEEGIRNRCVTAAREHFSVEMGVRSYRNVYRELLEDGFIGTA